MRPRSNPIQFCFVVAVLVGIGPSGAALEARPREIGFHTEDPVAELPIGAVLTANESAAYIESISDVCDVAAVSATSPGAAALDTKIKSAPAESRWRWRGFVDGSSGRKIRGQRRHTHDQSTDCGASQKQLSQEGPPLILQRNF